MSELDLDPKGPDDDVDNGEPTPPAPDPAVEELKKQNAAFKQELDRQREIAERLAFAAIEGRRAPEPAPTKTAAPNRDEDPDGWMEFMVKQRVEETLKSQLGPIVNTYTQDRGRFLDASIRSAKAEVASMYPDQWAAHRAEVEEYLKVYPPEVVANPSAVEEALFRIVGRSSITKGLPNPPTPPPGRPTSPPTDLPPKPVALDDRTARMAAREGLTAETFTALKGSGRMTVDDYLALAEREKAAATKKKGAR